MDTPAAPATELANLDSAMAEAEAGVRPAIESLRSKAYGEAFAVLIEPHLPEGLPRLTWGCYVDFDERPHFSGSPAHMFPIDVYEAEAAARDFAAWVARFGNGTYTTRVTGADAIARTQVRAPITVAGIECAVHLSFFHDYIAHDHSLRIVTVALAQAGEALS
jgi:hypothetical protein